MLRFVVSHISRKTSEMWGTRSSVAGTDGYRRVDVPLGVVGTEGYRRVDVPDGVAVTEELKFHAELPDRVGFSLGRGVVDQQAFPADAIADGFVLRYFLFADFVLFA
jgi:hypothetical protein